jgi:SAM-dependent methyltransferase
MDATKNETRKLCAICGHAGPHATYLAHEMMFGTREAFSYFECGNCGVLQIETAPDDLPRFYPAEYYAHQPPRVKAGVSLRRTTRRLRLRISRSLGMRALSPLSDSYAWLEQADTDPDARILDVGCGAGRLLLKLHEYGFAKLTGVDPYIQEDLRYPTGLVIHKKHLKQLQGSFDLVMAHHSFEHMPDPRNALSEMARLCAPGGAVLLRVPITGNAAWRSYGTNWVQLDAPRHLFLFTRKGLEHLACNAGLTLESMVFDSRGFQFWGSEQYLRGLPLEGPRKPAKPLFSPSELEAYEKRAVELNAKEDGDQASIVLRRSTVR